jgi:hypothetical protein
MPLVPTTLNLALEQAFDKAMFVFAETIANSPQGTNVADKARKAAAKVFANIATPAIDVYIKSATITIPPGQVVSSVGPTGPVLGSTTAPSPPAIII